MPLDYQSETGPKLTCRFAMGEYQGKPSFLLHSPGKGFYWKNIPPELETLIGMPNMEHSCKNFALGPNGLFWYTYRSVKDVYEQKGSASPSLWSTLNEDWKGGCPIRLSLGPQGFWWGEKEWIENPTTKNHLVQAFGVQPQSLVNESKQKYPGIRSFEIDFVTIGVKGAWVMGTNTGEPCWAGITEQLERTLKREMEAGHRVKNVVLCPVRHDIYWIEYADGTVDYFLPVDWDIHKIASYVKTHVNQVEEIWKPWDIPKPSVSGKTQLRQVKQGGDAWKFIEKLFDDGWRHPHKRPIPKISLIFEVVWSVSLHTSFVSYLDRIEQKGKFTIRQQIKGNQAYGWHGTRRRCNIGDDPSPTRLNQFCSDANCATCVILTKSFDANFAGKAPGRAFLRFGRAIYTSTVSSKADDYQQSAGSQYKSLILARTIKGMADTRKVGDKKLVAPNAGFDCVEGQVGQELNYDECCFYHNDAVRPAFLVLYK
ncbi:hypothetical protein FRB90_003047 [Tulasnella sp. 427]|nr:hypothetical protein FRB90_003047 [Tulasnella sp. 427]